MGALIPGLPNSLALGKFIALKVILPGGDISVRDSLSTAADRMAILWVRAAAGMLAYDTHSIKANPFINK
jgi:hypothetical protein